MADGGELSGRVAWVTGGASGMGLAAALRLAEMGAWVAVGSLTEDIGRDRLDPGQRAYTPDHSVLEAAREKIAALGGRVLAMPLDITRQDSVDENLAAIERELGAVDILINAAGNSGRSTMVGHPDSLWQAMLEVNLTGSYRTTKACMDGMIARKWGRIVMFSSTAGLVGGELHAAYCAAKHGLLGLMKCVALEGAPHGVTCNAICPGWVATDQNERGCVQEMAMLGLDLTVPEYRARMAQKWVPQKRFLEPEEPGAYAAFLCSEAARGITGEALRISGGSTW
jgi:3-hydroxybutyrate dehydrogenase